MQRKKCIGSRHELIIHGLQFYRKDNNKKGRTDLSGRRQYVLVLGQNTHCISLETQPTSLHNKKLFIVRKCLV